MSDGHWTTCYRCKCRMWLPQALYETSMALRDKGAFYCAYGHGQHFRPEEQIREEDEVRRQRDRLRQDNARLEEVAADARRKLALAVKSQARTVKRIHAGLCPHCNRTFTNMARHMSTKHKGEV